MKVERKPAGSRWRDVHGILLFDKPSGPSSNRALQQVRRIYRAAKAGHTGSLDPLASGLLPICFGEATKIAGLLLGSDKAYEAECRLGETTSTDDMEGEVLSKRPVPSLSADAIRIELAALTGAIVQVPPAYSAIKRAGVPLYRRARRGENVSAPPRQVEVRRFDLLESDADTLRLRIECGPGTYVRSLVRDLGERLGCGAHLTALRRLWAEPFRGHAMVGIDQLNQLAEAGEAVLDGLLLPIEAAFGTYPQIRLEQRAADRLAHGQPVQIDAEWPVGRCAALDIDGRTVALCECDEHGLLRVLRGFRRTG
ncbi:MAG: tRNA pseudouridine(55) synthase TruB [Rhodanobacteraceae bacterium]